MLLSDLNEGQRAAVLHSGAPLLVLAGAGSGKTRVIIYRIARLLDEGVAPEAILGLTFTNKAAEEMRSRIRGGRREDAEAARGVTLCTFHSLGVRILREEGARVGVRPGFTILDAEDQRQVVRGIIESEGLDPEVLPPAVAAAQLSRARTDGLGPAELETRARSHGERLLARVLRAYVEQLAALGALDFDDLLLRPVRILSEHAEVRHRLRERYRHILVDEYQDSNRVQLELVRLLAGDARDLVVVGDDDQGIYGWRGACLDNILEFERHFPGAVAMNLTRNYRSSGRVLRLANHVIRGARRRRDKELWTRASPGPAIRLVVCASPQDEAAFVAMEIDRLAREEQLRYDDVGVLYRTNGQSREMEVGMRAAGIPHRVVGGMAFFERREVKDALAYLRLLANPRDELAFLRAVAVPARGIGPASLARLRQSAEMRLDTLPDACLRADRVAGLGARVAREAVRFGATLESFSRELEGRADRLDLSDLADRLFDVVGLREALRSAEGGRKPSAVRFYLENVDALVAFLASYQRQAEEPELADFLRRVALEGNDRGDDPDAPKDRGKVTLMTLHAAKGLEFSAVFLAGVEEGLLPHGRSVQERDGDDDEERRLFYVGVTRAERWLTLTRCAKRTRFDGAHYPEPSRYVASLPDGLIEHVDRSRGVRPTNPADAAAGFRRLWKSLD